MATTQITFVTPYRLFIQCVKDNINLFRLNGGILQQRKAYYSCLARLSYFHSLPKIGVNVYFKRG